MKININGEDRHLDVSPEMPLLWALRDELGLTGTKFGCGMAQCGACTVHVDGVATRSCMLPLDKVGGKKVTTIEGLAPMDGELHPVQKAWLEYRVSQCGYCQAGQMMAASALLSQAPNPSDDDIDVAMGGHLCRCGSYPRIRKAIMSLRDEGEEM